MLKLHRRHWKSNNNPIYLIPVKFCNIRKKRQILSPGSQWFGTSSHLTKHSKTLSSCTYARYAYNTYDASELTYCYEAKHVVRFHTRAVLLLPYQIFIALVPQDF